MNCTEFAKLCGCSSMTISRAFSAPEKVREPLRRKILELAEQYAYRPNRIASGMIKGKSHLIGVINHSSSVKYFRDINCGIARELLKNGYMPVIMELGYGNSLGLVRKLADYQVDGMIMINLTSLLTEEERKEFDLHNIPSVCIDSHSDRFDCGLYSDEEQGSQLAADLLLKHGGTRFAYFGQEHELKRISSSFKRVFRDEAFLDCLEKKNVPVRRLVRGVDLDKVFAADDYPDALLLQNDALAGDIYAACRKNGLCVPEDVQVIGFSDMDCCEFLEPKLTTIRQDGLAAGCRAARLMLDLIRAPESKGNFISMPVELIERNSTRKTNITEAVL